jgi:hypothetical protein
MKSLGLSDASAISTVLNKCWDDAEAPDPRGALLRPAGQHTRFRVKGLGFRV